jgi:nitrite reductase (NADH) small subunit
MMLQISSPPVTAQVRVCSIEELPVGLGRAFEVAGRQIAFFRTRRGGVFAVDNRCPHKGGPLAEGMLAGDAVVCPLHAFRFELATGDCDQPGTCPVGTYAVTLDGPDVYVTVPSGAAEAKQGSCSH